MRASHTIDLRRWSGFTVDRLEHQSAIENDADKKKRPTPKKSSVGRALYRETVRGFVQGVSDQTAIPLRHCNWAVRTREKARASRRSISSMLALLTFSAGVKRRQSGCGALSNRPS